MELLTKIAECGSITQAAKSIKMSYKAAWDAVDQMNNLAGEPLVERVTGGKGGIGANCGARFVCLADVCYPRFGDSFCTCSIHAI